MPGQQWESILWANPSYETDHLVLLSRRTLPTFVNRPLFERIALFLGAILRTEDRRLTSFPTHFSRDSAEGLVPVSAFCGGLECGWSSSDSAKIPDVVVTTTDSNSSSSN